MSVEHGNPPELGDKEEYTYFPKEVVSEVLGAFGYGPTKKWVDAMYIGPDQSIGVGVLRVTERRCQDHFGVLRGVDQAEALAQALLLLYKFTGDLPADQRPIMKELESVDFNRPVVPGIDLNLVVKKLPSRGHYFSGEGWALRGDSVSVHLSAIVGLVLSAPSLERYLAGEKRDQENSSPRFPLK